MIASARGKMDSSVRMIAPRGGLVATAALALALGLSIGCATPSKSPDRPAAPSTSPDDDDEVVTDEPTAEVPSAPPPATPLPPDYHGQAVRNAAQVFRNLQPEFRSCYKARLTSAPRAHGNVVVNVLIGPDGSAREVDTTGGAILGEAVMDCIVTHVRAAKFQPPHDGGTLRLKVPFAFRAVVKTVDGGAR